MCILIIEDETKIASYLVKGLIESGYTAECVHSGLEGLERLKNEILFFGDFRCHVA